MKLLSLLLIFWLFSAAAEYKEKQTWNRHRQSPNRSSSAEHLPKQTIFAAPREFMDKLEEEPSQLQEQDWEHSQAIEMSRKVQEAQRDDGKEKEEKKARASKKKASLQKWSMLRNPVSDQLPRGRKDLGNSNIDPKLSHLSTRPSPRPTIGKSRYADRNIKVGLTEAEKKDLGLTEGPNVGIDFDRESIRRGVIWQQILNKPKALAHRKK